MQSLVSVRGAQLQIRPELIDKIRKLIAANGSIKATARTVGVSPPTVRKYARDILDARTAGRADNYSAPPIPQALIERIYEALRDADSINGVARDLGLSHTTVKRHAKRFIDEMKQAGTLGNCICGKPRFHPWNCLPRSRRGLNAYEAEQMMQRRSMIIQEIRDGLTFAEIGRRFSIRPKNVTKYYRHMTAEEIQGRLDARARKRRKKKLADRTERFVFRPYKDPNYARLAALMPHWLSAASRDDALSELYLAHLEGRLSNDDLASEVKRFAAHTARDFESRFGPRSLDELAFENGRESLGDMIVDPITLEPLEWRLSA